MKKLSKEDVKNPDAFIATTDRVVQALHRHRKLLFVALGTVFLLGALAVGWSQYSQMREKTAQAALFSANEVLEGLLQPPPSPAPTKEEAPAPPAEAKTTKDLTEDELQPVIAGFKNVVKEFPGTTASLGASLHLAQLYSDRGDYEQARQALSQTVDGISAGDFFFGLIHTKLGSIYSALENCEQALSHYDKVVQSSTHSHLHPEALLKSGVCYEKLNRMEDAQQTYNRIRDDFSDTAAASSAESFLRLMWLKDTKN